MKTVLITGAAGQLGTVVTNYFLSKDYSIIAVVHNAASADRLPSHPNLHVLTADLRDENQAAEMISKAIEQFGNIDAALMLAGGYAGADIGGTSSADISSQINLNFHTAYHVARPLFEHMVSANSGRLVFIGARPAVDAQFGKNSIAYGLSKSLLLKLAEYINAEAKGKNVTATVVTLSTLDTEANRHSMPQADPDKWVKPSMLAEFLECIVSEKGDLLREPVLKVYGNA